MTAEQARIITDASHKGYDYILYSIYEDNILKLKELGYKVERNIHGLHIISW